MRQYQLGSTRLFGLFALQLFLAFIFGPCPGHFEGVDPVESKCKLVLLGVVPVIHQGNVEEVGFKGADD